MLSLKKILDINPSVIYPGHGPVISQKTQKTPKEKIEEYIAHRHQREEQILAALRDSSGKKLTAMDIVKLVYKVNLSFYICKNIQLFKIKTQTKVRCS